MIRCRFKVNAEDPRPVIWPIKHPYWCTGYGEGRDDEEYAIIVAYADDEDEILRNWPDARDLDSQEAEAYAFTDRFRRPEWFTEPKASV